MQMAHLTHDYRFMPQIVSSAIWNCPPPSKLVTLLEQTSRSSKVMRHTQEKMVRAFEVNLAALSSTCPFHTMQSEPSLMRREYSPRVLSGLMLGACCLAHVRGLTA